MGKRFEKGLAGSRYTDRKIDGWLKKLMVAVLLMSLFAIMAACENRGGETGAESASPSPSSASPGSASPSANATPSSAPSVSPGMGSGIAASLTELSICQLNRGEDGGEFSGASSCIVNYGTEPLLIMPALPLPEKPESYALYMEEVYFFVKFGTNDEKTLERLTGQIKAEGGTLKLDKEQTQLDGSNIRYKGRVTGIKGEVVLTFGDVPPITLKRSDRKLAFEVEPALMESKKMLILQGAEHSAQLLMPEREKEAVLVFSEPIRTDKAKISAFGNDPGIRESAGKWLDDRRLSITVPDGTNEWHVNMQNIFSVDGSYFGEPWDGNVKLRGIPERTWRHFPSGGPVLESAYAKYYDFILFSPDKRRALGMIEIGGPNADEGGRYFAVVLDRPGQPPAVVRSPMHFPDVLMNPPLAWLDDERIAYVDYLGWKLYDIPSGRTKTLADASVLGGYFNSMAFDEHDRTLYLLTQRYDEADGTIRIDRWSMDGEGKTAVNRDFTTTVLASKYHTLKLTVIPRKDGVLWTKTRDGKAVTEFVMRNGRKLETAGAPVAAAGQKIYVSEQPAGDKPKWFEWTPGKERGVLPDTSGRIVPFGSLLTTEEADGTWKLYDPDKKRWVAFPQQRKTNLYPEQPFQAIYREDVPK